MKIFFTAKQPEVEDPPLSCLFDSARAYRHTHTHTHTITRTFPREGEMNQASKSPQQDFSWAIVEQYFVFSAVT